MRIIFNDWRSLAVVVAGILLVVFVFTGRSAEVLQFVLEAIRASRQ